MRKLRLSHFLALFGGFGVLYVPILVMIAYSFDSSKLVTIWGGFSLRWYQDLLKDQQLLDSLFLSLKLAFVAATSATILATFAAVALDRVGTWRGRMLMSGMILAPLVMPEVITGLSLLLLFVALSLERGFFTLLIAHITLTLPFATVVLQSRLKTFDKRLEEAAQDLGATPVAAFLTVTLPIILPALISAWMLAFVLSLDDLVIANFTTGPGATTLPMRLYSAIRLGVSPEVNAISTVLIGAVALIVCFATYLSRGKEEK